MGVNQSLADVVDQILDAPIFPDQSCAYCIVKDCEIKEQCFVGKGFGEKW